MLLFVLFGNVYTAVVGAIVCWWRLEIHNRVPGECHCRSLPQLAIVRPGVVTGWVSFSTWLVLRVETPLPVPDRGEGDHSPISAWSHLSYHTHLGPFCLGHVLFMSCLVEFLWPGGKERGVLTSGVTSGPQFLHL